MSDTPITDAASRACLDPYLPSWVIPADVAESLERQLAEVTKQRDALGDTLKSRDADLAYRDDEWNKIRGQRDALANAIINAADVLATLKGDKP